MMYARAKGVRASGVADVQNLAHLRLSIFL